MGDFCRSCECEDVTEVLDLGCQPASNHFPSSATEPAKTYPLKFGFCPRCGLAQLIQPVGWKSIIPRHAWLSYNEPETHLDLLVDSLSAHHVNSEDAVVRGITYKDDSTLARLRRLGFCQTERLDPVEDLGIHDPLAGFETIQNSLSSSRAGEIVARKGLANLLVVRHLLEHAHQPRELLKACQKLTAPGGVMVFEVPDARKMINGGDHCFLWEEHIVYFTPDTLHQFFEGAGLTDCEIKVYEFTMEDSLVAIVRNTPHLPKETLFNPCETAAVQSFASSFKSRASSIRDYLKERIAERMKIVMFGAGHLSLKFINYYELSPYLEAVIDDNPHKQGLFMAGSGLPIVPSSFLDTVQIDICILGLSLESEQKVLHARAGFVARGGKFLSAFSASALSIDAEMRSD